MNKILCFCSPKHYGLRFKVFWLCKCGFENVLIFLKTSTCVCTVTKGNFECNLGLDQEGHLV